MPKSKSKITTNKKNMFNKLKRNKRLSKKQTGGVNIVDLYNIKDELFMIYVLDMINFKASKLKTSTNNNTTSIELKLDIFPNDKYINNTLNTITYTNTAITHKKNMQYKSCSNFTTFFYFIRYLIEIKYLKILKTDPTAKTEAATAAKAADDAEKKKEELKRLFITVNNAEYQYVQHVYSYNNSIEKVHLTPESLIDHFYNHEIKPYLDTKPIDYDKFNYDTISIFRNLYDNYIYTKIYKYEYCDLIYNTFINYAKKNGNVDVDVTIPIDTLKINNQNNDDNINNYNKYISKYYIGNNLRITQPTKSTNKLFGNAQQQPHVSTTLSNQQSGKAQQNNLTGNNTFTFDISGIPDVNNITKLNLDNYYINPSVNNSSVIKPSHVKKLSKSLQNDVKPLYQMSNNEKRKKNLLGNLTKTLRNIKPPTNHFSGNTPSINGHLIDFYAEKLKDFVAYPQYKHDIFIKLNKQVKPINIVYKILYIAYNILNKITTTHSNNT